MRGFKRTPGARNKTIDVGARILAASSAASLVLSIALYFSPGSGIDHTGGVMLVVVATALLLAASLVMLLDRAKANWLRLLLNVATFLDLVGTGCATYLLEAHWLLGLTALGLAGWFIHVLLAPSERGLRNPAGNPSQVAL